MSDEMQKSIKRWLEVPTGTYPNVDSFFSRLRRDVLGDMVIKDFDQDDTVSESEVTMWVSRGRGDDETGNGSFEKPYYTIQKAIDEAVARGGHRLHKTINIEAKYKSRRDVYAPFICRTRNITIRGVGGAAQIYSDWYALGDDPGTVGSISTTVFTNMTEAGLASFVDDGGIDYTYSSGSLTWTGGALNSRETDDSLNTSGTGSVSWSAYEIGLQLENLSFYKMSAKNSIGNRSPACAFIFSSENEGDKVMVRDISMEKCEFYVLYSSNPLNPTIFVNNISGVQIKVSQCLIAKHGQKAVFLNCYSFFGDNFDYGNYSINTEPPIIVEDKESGVAGLKSSGCSLGDINTSNGVTLYNSGTTSINIVGRINNSGPLPITFNGPVRLDKNLVVNSTGSFLMNNTYGSQGKIAELKTQADYVQEAGNIYSYSGEIGGDCVINGGTFKADGMTIRGNLVVADGATIDFGNVTVIGNVTLGNTSVVTGWKGGSYHGTLTDNGTHTFPAAGTLMNK